MPCIPHVRSARVLALPDNVALATTNITPIAASMLEDKASDTTLLQKQLRSLLTYTFWPPLLWYFYITSCLVPIRYAIHGQKDQPREELLDRDNETGVAYPKKEATKTRLSWWSINAEHHRAVMVFYTVLVLVSSFWWL